MDVVDGLLRRNADFAARRVGRATTAVPALRLAVVTCMDARIDTSAVLGLHEGDAHVIRNAGGVITDDVVRSLALSQRYLGTDTVVLVHHTDCAMQRLDAAAVRADLAARAGTPPPFEVGAFDDTDAHVRASLAALRASPFLSTAHLRAFVYDVRDGRLRELPSRTVSD